MSGATATAAVAVARARLANMALAEVGHPEVVEASPEPDCPEAVGWPIGDPGDRRVDRALLLADMHLLGFDASSLCWYHMFNDNADEAECVVVSAVDALRGFDCRTGPGSVA